MPSRQRYSGIERKIVTPLLWVGITPMMLGLAIGYFSYREVQRRMVEDHLTSLAAKTAKGLSIQLESRLDAARQLTTDPKVVDTLRRWDALTPADLDALRQRLPTDALDQEDVDPVYVLYDEDGRALFTSEAVEESPEPLVAPESITATRIVSFDYNRTGRYIIKTVSPVYDAATGGVLGFLKEERDVQRILEYVLGGDEESQRHSIRYEVAYFGEGQNILVYLENDIERDMIRARFGVLDEQLADRILRNRDRPADAFPVDYYETRGERVTSLLAYERLDILNNLFLDLYLIVYQPQSVIYAPINRGAILIVSLGALVIAGFCLLAYRNVNNNIVRPLSLLNEGAQIIRQGDLDLKLKIGTGDEIEELASSFNKMALALRTNITQLEESEEKYRGLITSMRDGIYRTDVDGMLNFVNPAGIEILGYSGREEVEGRALKDLFVDPAEYEAFMQSTLSDDEAPRTRLWMKRPGVKPVCVEISGSRMADAAGNSVGLEGTFRDVTQNVRLEQEAEERSERIAAINQIANAINSSLEAGRVYESLVNEMRMLVAFDYAAVALLEGDGYEFETRQLWPEPSGDAGSAVRHDGPASVAARVARDEQTLIIDNLRMAESSTQEQFPPDVSSILCVPLYATGRILGTLNLGAAQPAAFTGHESEVLQQMAPHIAVAIRNAQLLENLQQSLEDVTRAREKLHDANEELKTLDEMKTNLLSNVSHELRTPLVAVMGYTDMILNEKTGPINEMQREYLGISIRNIEKLVTLIENLLDFSRLHRGQEEMVFDTFDLVDCARLSLQIVRPVADARSIAIGLKATSDTIWVEGDKGKMGQVFNNLLSNAVKFNRNGGRVDIDMEVKEGWVHVAVADTGIGIPSEALDKVFTRFYQYDSSSTRKYGGTGIGLSIAQDIMRLHGSLITVSSAEKAGTTFRFALPMIGAARSETDDERGAPLPTETHLLVEVVTQDRALSAQIRNVLVSEGMDVIHAAYPAAAMTLAAKYSPDCMLLDSEAGPIGHMLVDEILAEPAAGTVPIMLLTHDDALFDRYRDRLAGRIKRGFRKSTLLSGIHYALSRGIESGAQLGPKVLCVDDDPEITRFIANCLESEGLETDVCSSGEEAYERAMTGEYWMVLLDIAMPGMDGWETCRRIRSESQLEGIDIYFVTAKPMEQHTQRVHECGANGYLQKPFKADDLLGLVEQYRRQQDVPVA